MTKNVIIGDVAKMFGLSSQALRYYEKKGILTSHHVAKNSYRYYPCFDIAHLMKAKYLQSMGFSLSVIREGNMQGMPLDDWLEHLDKHSEAYEQEMEKLSMVLHEIAAYRKQISNVKDLFGNYEIMDSPDLYFLTLSDENDEINDETWFFEEIKKWIDLFPITRYASLYAKDNLQKPCGQPDQNGRKRGLIMPVTVAEYFGIKENRLVQRLPSRRCVSTIIRCKHREDASVDTLFETLDYMRKQGLEVGGDAIGVWIVTLKEDTGTKYYRTWVPLRSIANGD